MMVGSHWYCYLFSLISLLLCTVASPMLHHCHDDQRDALLEFKGEFPTQRDALPYNSEVYFGSLSSWNKSSDCCSWEEVKCGAKSGKNWSNMITTSTYEDNTLELEPYMDIPSGDVSYSNSMEMVHKGTNRNFERIRIDFRAIDFSGNRFCGNIPASIGLLKQLRLLNLSGNAFTSRIPQSLANLTKLEEIDLSQNQLSGQIPRDLGSLTFLSTMNFSHNNLEGPVPGGTQFQSQNCSSFMGNPKLYGLKEICGKIHVPNQASQEPVELSEPEELEINWIAAAIAVGPGVFCGLVIGYIFVSHNNEWFMEKFYKHKHRVTIIGR